MTTLTITPALTDTALTDATPKTDTNIPSWCKNASVGGNPVILDGLPAQQLQEKGITINSGGIASHIFTVIKDDVAVQFQLSALDPLLIVSIPKGMKLSAVIPKAFNTEDYTPDNTEDYTPDSENSKKTKQTKQRVWPTFRDSTDSITIRNPNAADVMGVINAVFALEQK